MKIRRWVGLPGQPGQPVGPIIHAEFLKTKEGPLLVCRTPYPVRERLEDGSVVTRDFALVPLPRSHFDDYTIVLADEEEMRLLAEAL